MDRKGLKQIDKALYIVLVILAAAAAFIAMVTGPLGCDEISIAASAGACIIAVGILWRTIRAFGQEHRK